jgi:WD40 repeat protein
VLLLFGILKAMDWCPWQSEVLAVGGGMKDGCLHILDINTGRSIQIPSINTQVDISSGAHLHVHLLESHENNLRKSIGSKHASRHLLSPKGVSLPKRFFSVRALNL